MGNEIKIKNDRWELTFQEEEIINFPKGLLGFEKYNRYVIVNSDEHEPFQWLICIDNPDIGFVILNPLHFCPDYNPDVTKERLKDLQLEDPQDLCIYTIVTLDENPLKTTANLCGPIFVNSKERVAKQIVLTDGSYSTRHRILNS